MRRTTAHRALLLAIGFSGVTTEACFSSSSGGPPPADDGATPDAAEMDSSITPDAGPDSTLPGFEGGTPEASPEASPMQEAGPDGCVCPDAGEAGGPGILLPGNVAYSVRIGVNHATSKFYVAWDENPQDGGPSTHGISVIDAKTGAITGTLDVQAIASPFVDETNDLIYVPTRNKPDGSASFVPIIEVFDGTNNTLVPSKSIYQAQGQTLDSGQFKPLSNLGINNIVVDQAAGHLFALLGDGSGNSFVVEYDTTTGMALASIEITGSEPAWGAGNEPGGGLVLDPGAHTLWVVTSTRNAPAFGGAGAYFTVIDTQAFAVTASSAKQTANASDVTFDPAGGGQALMFLPQSATADAGGVLPAPGTVLSESTGGGVSSAFTPPAGLAALFGRVLGPSAYVYANSDAGAYYVLGYNVPDAGAWSLHGQSAAIAPQPQPGPFQTGSVLNAYSFEVVTDATNAYVIATMNYDEYNGGGITPGTFSTPYVQYWTVPLP